MNLRHVAYCGLGCAIFALTACDGGRVAPPKVTVRVANAAPGFAVLGYSREQPRNRDPDSLAFKTAVEASYDVDTYDFHVYERSVGTYVPRTWTFARELQAEHGYTFVLTEVGGEVETLVLESPAAPAADAQIDAVHVGSGLPALDLYLEQPGVGIAGATPRGTFNAQEQIAPQTIASGEYELWLTAAGNPADVLLTTTPFSLPAGVTSTFIVVPEVGLSTPQLSVMVIQPSTSAVLYDRNSVAELRVLNGAADSAPRDFAIDGQFTPPLFSAAPFAEPTAFTPIAAGNHTINVTPVANPGVLELDQPLVGLALQRMTLVFGGAAGTLTHTIALDDGRRIHNEAKLLFANAATQFTSVDFVLTIRDGDPTDALPARSLVAPGAAPNYDAFGPGDYDLYLRETGTTTLVAGPLPITLAGDGLYGVLAINGPDTATAGVALFDDFP